MGLMEIALIAGTTLSATSALASGAQQKKAYEQQAQQAQLQAEAQITDRTRALNETLANQNAMMGASGRTLSSIDSVIKGDEKKYQQDIATIKSGADLQSSQYQSAGSASMATGATSALGTLGMGAYKYSMIGTPK